MPDDDTRPLSLVPKTRRQDHADDEPDPWDAPDYVDRMRKQAIGDAVKLAQAAAPTRPSFDKRRRRKFIELLGTGASIREAAEAVGMSARTIYMHRSREPEFDEAVALAIEAGTAPVMERLQAIALYGDPKSMATVRAAETYLQGAHRDYRRTPRGTQRVSLEQTGPDGTTRRITASTSLIPD